MKLHFISGLPRSGSTLLAALLRQNPRFHHGGMSSPVAQIVMRVQHATSRGSEGAVLVNEEQRKRLLRGIFGSFYTFSSNVPEVIFDTNRAWCAKLPLLVELFPESKLICMVRDLPWVLNSVEKLIRGNPSELSGLFGYNANTTVYGRVNQLISQDGLVGYAMNALRECYYAPLATGRVMLLDYEALVKRPAAALGFIYQFLGEEPFPHDLENFSYEAQEFDLSLGTPGLHRVSGPVEWREQQMLLPPDLAQRFRNESFWKEPKLNTRKVPVILVARKQQLQAVGEN